MPFNSSVLRSHPSSRIYTFLHRSAKNGTRGRPSSFAPFIIFSLDTPPFISPGP